MKIALIGNPNSGKTTLFNVLTGKNEKTGNWTGVTTVKAAGKYRGDKNIELIDLPGVYSFSAESKDEKEVVDFLKKGDFDAVINVADSTNLERNLYLTYLLAGLNVPYVVALNFSDECIKQGLTIDEKVLSDFFGAEFIKISAKQKINTDKLIFAAKNIKKREKSKNFSVSKNSGEIYSLISAVFLRAVKRNENLAARKPFNKDDILTGKFTGIPVFIAVIFAVYFFSLKVGGYFGGYIETFFLSAEKNATAYFAGIGVPKAINSLFSVAVLRGIGSVISFLPQILVLFVLLTVLEEVGYMARVAFILDKLFYRVGLGGKSVIPFVLSCGCAVSGISATRTISDEKERKNAVFLCPFMPCGAKTAVFGWFSYKFFGGSALVSVAMYFLGILAAVIVGAILNKNETGDKFVLEIPPIRKPSFYVVFKVVKDKTKEFLFKSGTVIFSVSVLFWFLSSFGAAGYTQNAEESFLFYIGNSVKYLFYPLGFSDWKASVALFSGLFAKEAVIETAQLLNLDFSAVLPSGYKLFSYMIFILLSPPCGAALAAAAKELKSLKDFAFMFFVQTLTAFAFCSLVNFAGNLLCRKGLLFSIALIIIILSIGLVFFKIGFKGNKCLRCRAKCKKTQKRNTII